MNGLAPACAAAVALAGLLTTSVSASDMYTGAPPYAGAYDWSGLYLGAVVGYNWNKDRTTEYLTATGQPRNIAFDYDLDGVSGGVKAGFNFQSGRIVYGAEADFEWTDITGGFIDRIENIGQGVDHYDWQASIRGRLGVAFDRVLVYGTAGVSFARIENIYTLVPFAISEPIEDVRTGWTAGGGVEYAVTENVVAGIDYRYTEFDRFSNVSVSAFPGLTGTQQPTSHGLRLSLGYKF